MHAYCRAVPHPERVSEIDSGDTHTLRRAVLRGGDASSNVSWAEDARPGAFHLGVREPSGEVIAVASFSQQGIEARPGQPAWRLRGMAVAHSQQGRGIGRLILDEAIRMVRERGARVLWCNARDTAMNFYAGAGFVVVGEGFTTDETGLPHHLMVLDL